MATSVNLVPKFEDASTGKSWSKSFKGVDTSVITDKQEAVDNLKAYAEAVAGDLTAAEYQTVEELDVTGD